MVKGDKLPGQFARKLKEWRAEKTRAELDKALSDAHGLSVGYTALLENNRIKPPGKAVCETIAATLGVDPPEDVWNLAMEERLVAFDPELAEWVEGRYEAGVKAERARVAALRDRYESHLQAGSLGQLRMDELDLLWKLREVEAQHTGFVRATWALLESHHVVPVLRVLARVGRHPNSGQAGALLAALEAVARAVSPLAADNPKMLLQASGDPDGFSEPDTDELEAIADAQREPATLAERIEALTREEEKSEAPSKPRRTRKAKGGSNVEG